MNRLTDEVSDLAKLLGLRVIIKTGMVGEVTAISKDGAFELCNENEQNRYSYWCSSNEITFVYLPIS